MADTKTLPWDDFRLVKAIADAKGMPGAAEALGVNHSTVFRRLGQIEEAVGKALFERHRAGYALTPAGEEMVALAETLDAQINGFMRKCVGRDVEPEGELRVTTNDTLLANLLTPIFADFQRQYESLRLDIVLSNQSLNLSRRDADVAIRATDHPPETLVGRRAAKIVWALYGRAQDFAQAAPMAMEDLYRQRWISLGDDFAALNVHRFVRQHVQAERVVYKVNTVLGLAEAVEAGIGIGFLPCFIADVRPTLVRLAPPDPSFGTDLWLLTHPDLRHAARVRVFLDFIAGKIARMRGLLEGTRHGGDA